MKRDNHPINQIMEQAIEKINRSIDIDKVVGTPIVSQNNDIIIPISKVSVGYVAGGGEYAKENPPKNAEKEYPFAGGSGAGYNVSPVGFLVCNTLGTKYIDICNKSAYDKLLEIFVNLSNNLKKDA